MNINKPLSESELDDLDQFLGSESCSEDAMNVSSLHGYLTALAVGPGPVPPSEWLPLVWGQEEPIFDSQEEGQRIFTLLMRMFNSVAQELEHGLGEFAPLLYEDDLDRDEEPYMAARDWCLGFGLGVALRADDWRRLFDDQEAAVLLAPIVAFSSEDAMAEILGEVKGEVDRDLLVSMLPISAVALYEYWQKDRRKFVENLTTESAGGHTAPRVGRNDPCICGSGKKYKNCCGAAKQKHANQA
jgi:uncharacterized protein